MNKESNRKPVIWLSAQIAAATLLVVASCAVWAAAGTVKTAPNSPTGAAPVVVQGKLGGEIMGYDIDQNGSEGLLSEVVTFGVDEYEVAT
jgi:hypothetical protein